MTILAWGVKQSFRAYVAGSGGAIAVSGGAQEAGDDGFTFEPAGDSTLTFGPDGRPQGQGRFNGGLSFQAHGGLLSVAFSDPWVDAGPEAWGLSVADASGRRAAFATLDVAGLRLEADGAVVIPTAITLDGMMILGDHYPPGTALDPVILRRG